MGKKLTIRGPRVQGVGYRLFLLWEAERIGIKRFQANNVGKDLVVLLDGPDELVERFLRYAREKRPEGAEVEEVIEEEFEDSVMSIEAYHRLLMTEQLFKIVNVGIELKGGQEKLIEGQKVLISGQEKLLRGQEKLIRGQEKLMRGQEGIREEIKGLREDIRTLIEERLSRIEADIARIKAKIGIE